jgi:hypothetical protein
MKVINKFIMVILICDVLWGVIIQQNLIPLRLKLTNKISTTKIDNKEINSTAISGKKFILYENKQSKEAAPFEVEHVTIPTNASISNTSSINVTLNDRELTPMTTDSNNTQSKNLSSPDAVWNARKFIITTTAKNYYAVDDIQANTNESKPQRQSENESNTSTEPDQVHCPLVEKVQQTAQKINEAFLTDGTYVIISHDPVFQDSNLDWLVGATGIVAGSSDEAIYMAGITTSKTNLRKNEYAAKVDKAFTSGGLYAFFVCYYEPGNIMAVGVWDKMFVDE